MDYTHVLFVVLYMGYTWARAAGDLGVRVAEWIKVTGCLIGMWHCAPPVQWVLPAVQYTRVKYNQTCPMYVGILTVAACAGIR